MKKGVFVFAVLLLSMLFIGSVSGYYFPSIRGFSQNAVNSYVDAFEPILDALLGGEGGWSGFLLFERLLIFLILTSLIYVVSGRINLIEKQTVVRWIISLAIPLIAIRAIDHAWLIAIIDQYKFLGIIITSVLPFIIFFYFLYNVAGDHGIIRKMGWLVFVGVYVGLWSGAEGDYTSAIYFWTFIVALVCLLGDNTINRRLRIIERMKRDDWFKDRQLTEINNRLKEMTKELADGTAHNPSHHRQMIRELESQKKWLMRQ